MPTADRWLKLDRGRLWWWSVWEGDRHICSGVTLTRRGALKQAREFLEVDPSFGRSL